MKKLRNRGVDSAEYHALLSAYHTAQGNRKAARREAEKYKTLAKDAKNPLLIDLFIENDYLE